MPLRYLKQTFGCWGYVMTNSYLDYIDKPTTENIKAVHRAHGMIQPVAAGVAGIGLQTYRGWCSSEGSINFRTPHATTWNLFMYELEARRLGYESIFDYFKSNLLT